MAPYDGNRGAVRKVVLRDFRVLAPPISGSIINGYSDNIPISSSMV